MPLIRWTILMSPRGRTRDDGTSHPFRTYVGYSGWIMAGKDNRVCHLPERVLRQYWYVQTISRAPTDIRRLAADDVA